MGICVSVEVEGEDLVGPIEERTDGKPLADFVASVWLYEDLEKLRRWGLPSWTVESLRKVDADAYGEAAEGTPDPWQDPKVLAAALRALKEWRIALRGNPRVAKELDDHHFDDDEWYEPQIEGIEDGVARCEWATARGKRAKLTAW